MTKVSIIISSYNHADYIGLAIESVLNQRYQDFEIIIADDASSDHTIEVVNSYLEKDSRIRFFNFSHNRLEHMKNYCLKYAKGEYIAILNSDDVFHPEKIFRQVEYMDNHPETGAVFTGVAWINENGTEIKGREAVFSTQNRNRHQWLRHFLIHGNCLCHSSALIRNELMTELGHYNRWFALFSDMDMWMKICLQKEIHILPEIYTYNRLLSGEKNASGSRPEIFNRMFFEHYNIIEHYYSDSALVRLNSIFPEIEGVSTANDLEKKYLLSLYLLKSEHYPVRFYGLNRLYELHRDPAIVCNLVAKFGENSISDFYKYTAKTQLVPLLYPVLEVNWKSIDNTLLKSDKIFYPYDIRQEFIFSLPKEEEEITMTVHTGNKALRFFIYDCYIVNQLGERVKELMPALVYNGGYVILDKTEGIELAVFDDSFFVSVLCDLKRSDESFYLKISFCSELNLKGLDINFSQNLEYISARRLLNSLVKKLLKRIKVRI